MFRFFSKRTRANSSQASVLTKLNQMFQALFDEKIIVDYGYEDDDHSKPKPVKFERNYSDSSIKCVDSIWEKELQKPFADLPGIESIEHEEVTGGDELIISEYLSII